MLEEETRLSTTTCNVLVVNDNLFHFVELVPSERTDHIVVLHALVDWFKRFGVAETHVGDKGSHFKNKVVAELNDILKTKHHFTTAYSPKRFGVAETHDILNDILNDHVVSTQLSIFRGRRDKKSMPTPCASITTHP